MQQVLIKTYKGTQQSANKAFTTDAAKMAANGYFPTTQAWAEGAYGCGSFIVALLFCFVFIGFLIFFYMLIVKPAGTLTVTYGLQAVASTPLQATVDEKTCPRCAEQVKAAAQVCRHCGHSFI